MAKLYFYYSTMNAGKSTLLLQASYNYQERGMHPLLLTPAIDDRFEKGYIHSRAGLNAPALMFERTENLFDTVAQQHKTDHVNCVFIDEAQFLTQKQVRELSRVVDELKIPVLCYGLRLDYRAQTFEGSHYLLAWADELHEIKTICHCGAKANHVLRMDEKGTVIRDGAQIVIGGNEQYVSVCRKHFYEAFDRPDPSIS